MADQSPQAAVAVRRFALPSLSDEQATALREAWRAFWISRAVIWGTGLAIALATGTYAEPQPRLDPLWFAVGFDEPIANLLLSPAVRWDGIWYLEIAEFGYDVDARAAFFPLYPGLVAAISSVLGSLAVGAVAVSMAASLAALYLLHRLVSIDFPAQVATAVVWLTACFPTALTFSAVYSEGLFLLLSVGSLLAARRGRWGLAGACGALAAATRSAGLLLLLPLLLLYFYGPRSDRPPDSPRRGWRPAYAIRRDLLGVLLVPVGLVAFVGFLWVTGENPAGPFLSQAEWSRILAPLAGIPLAVLSVLRGLIELTPGLASPIGSYSTGVVPELAAVRDLVLFGFGALAVWLVVEARRRRLPVAYQAYAAVSLALPLSVPALEQPLMSLPRFLLVIFPLWIALSVWALERNALGKVLTASMALSVLASALFSAWAWAP